MVKLKIHDEKRKYCTAAGPSTPVSVFGLDGQLLPRDKFNVLKTRKEAKQIASKRSQLM
jgi:translation initiation factor IF-2